MGAAFEAEGRKEEIEDPCPDTSGGPPCQRRQRVNSGPPAVFDRAAIARTRARADRMGKEPFLVSVVSESLVERIAALGRSFDRAVDIDPFPSAAPRLQPLARSWSPASLDRHEHLRCIESNFALAMSVLGLHGVNDLPGVMIQVRRLLNPGGLFAGALLGTGSLVELRHCLMQAETEHRSGASPRVAPLPDVRDVGSLLQRAGFAEPVVDVDHTTALYRSFGDLVTDLRANALSNTLVGRSLEPLSRSIRDSAVAHYRSNYAEPDGKLRASFELIYFVANAPGKPAAPQPLVRRKSRST